MIWKTSFISYIERQCSCIVLKHFRVTSTASISSSLSRRASLLSWVYFRVCMGASSTHLQDPQTENHVSLACDSYCSFLKQWCSPLNSFFIILWSVERYLELPPTSWYTTLAFSSCGILAFSSPLSTMNLFFTSKSYAAFCSEDYSHW